MNFDLNDEQRAIRDTARELLAARVKPEAVRAAAESRTYDADLWREVVELGWTGIAIDEAHGGQGLGMVELAILLEQTGYACAPLPLLGSAGAGLAIQAGRDAGAKETWLGAIGSGESTATFGLTPENGSGKLFVDSRKAAVAVSVSPGESSVAAAGDFGIADLQAIDATRSYGRVSASAGDGLGPDEGAGYARVSVAVAAELTGIGQRAMEMAVAYAGERQQFGRPIGAYQGVSHRCAQMLLDVEESRSLVYYAAWCADAEPESLPLAAAMAYSRAAEAAWSVAASALQVLGGIGFTWEHDLQFWLKRARVTGGLLDAARDRNRIAGFTGLN